jgi:hypothetical protein
VFASLTRGGEEEEGERGGDVTPVGEESVAEVSSLVCVCVPLRVLLTVPALVPVSAAGAVAVPAAELSLVVGEVELTVDEKWRRGRLLESSIGRDRGIRIAQTVR